MMKSLNCYINDGLVNDFLINMMELLKNFYHMIVLVKDICFGILLYSLIILSLLFVIVTIFIYISESKSFTSVKMERLPGSNSRNQINRRSKDKGKDTGDHNDNGEGNFGDNGNDNGEGNSGGRSPRSIDNNNNNGESNSGGRSVRSIRRLPPSHELNTKCECEMIFRDHCNQLIRNDRSLVNSTRYPYNANSIRDFHKFDRMFNEFYVRKIHYGDSSLDFGKLVKVYTCSFDRYPLGNNQAGFDATRDFLRQQIFNAASNSNQTATLDYISPKFRDVMANTSPEELNKYIQIVDKTI